MAYLFGPMLTAAAHDNAAKVAAAYPETLHLEILRVNEGEKFFKGKIGLRDIQRVVFAAGYTV
ncbi:MAG TPA: hypothetical protein PK022_08970 [Syntrophales bacterium]|nr:hypothetical protein [Syntrophales bacterium]